MKFTDKKAFEELENRLTRFEGIFAKVKEFRDTNEENMTKLADFLKIMKSEIVTVKELLDAISKRI